MSHLLTSNYLQEVWEKDFSDLHLEFDIPFQVLAASDSPCMDS